MTSKPSSPKVLLFDLGGVLVDNVMHSELERLSAQSRSPDELAQAWLDSDFVRRFELGQCTPSEFAQAIVQELSLKIDPGDFLSQFEHWPRGFYEGVETLLAQLREQYIVCCLSNSNETHWKHAITSPFHHAFTSHIIGHIKPDPEAFEFVLSELKTDAHRVFFFDDMVDNVTAAKRCGMNAYHTRGIEELTATLTDLGFLS